MTSRKKTRTRETKESRLNLMPDPLPFYADAVAQYEAGRFDDAIEAFRLLSYRYPFEGKHWFGLAAALQEKRDYESALEAWAATAIVKASDPYPHFHAAECYLSLNRIEEAGKALEETLRYIDLDHPLKEQVSLLREQWGL